MPYQQVRIGHLGLNGHRILPQLAIYLISEDGVPLKRFLDFSRILCILNTKSAKHTPLLPRDILRSIIQIELQLFRVCLKQNGFRHQICDTWRSH